MDKSNMISEMAHNGLHGYFVPDGAQIYPLVDQQFISQHYTGVPEKAKPSKPGYPKLFEDFWTAYHPERRTEKKATFSCWKKLSPEDKASLPKAAAAYTDYIIVESQPRYMKHSKRFIETGAYEDYVHRETQSAIITAIRYWDQCLRGVVGFAPAWKPDDQILAVNDIRRLSPKVWQEKAWIFFSGRDQMIEEQKKKLGIHYKTFHGMLTKELMTSRVKKPVPCEYCGELGGRHDQGCPIVAKKEQEAAKYREEIDEGKALGFDFKAAFEKEVGRDHD